MKTINIINGIIEKIKNDIDNNATFSLNENLELTKLNKKQMIEEGNFIYGINKDSTKEIYLELIFFLECNLGNKIFLGKWKNPKDNKIIIEIVKFGNDKKEVIELAKKHKQFSIYNIKEDKEIILQYEESKEGEN